MDGDPGVSHVVGGVEDGFEVVGHVVGVVPGASHLDGCGDVIGDDVSDGFEDIDGALRFTEEVSASGSSPDFLDGAGEVDIDGVVSHVGEDGASSGHFLREGSHDLSGDGVVIESGGSVVVEVPGAAFFGEEIWVFASSSFSAVDECLVEECFGNAVGAAVSSRDESHGGIGVSGESGLEEGRIESGGGLRDSWIEGVLLSDGVDGSLGDALWDIMWRQVD